MSSAKFRDFTATLPPHHLALATGLTRRYLPVDFCGDNPKKSEYNTGTTPKLNTVPKAKPNAMAQAIA
tara:strand:- start:27 stop:230 length:204 start_codon:yes stop_codon:yes gene_type:complete